MRDLHAELQKLDLSIALSLLDERLGVEADPLFAFEMNVTKAKLLSSQGKTTAAIDLLIESSRSSAADESASYFAAEMMVEDGQILRAIEFLEAAEYQIGKTGNTYFRDCIYLLHAYCEAITGRGGRALELLGEVVDEDEALFWLRVETLISVSNVREIASR